MAILLPKNLPRYECLIEAARRYPELDPSACEAFLYLLQSSNHVINNCENYFGEHNLSQGRFAVMMQLLDKENDWAQVDRTPAELAENTGVTRATMTGLIDTLERDGLVTRKPKADDRRMMSVHLTPAGKEILDRVLPGYFQGMAALMSPLAEGDRRTLVQLLAKLMRRSETQVPAAVS